MNKKSQDNSMAVQRFWDAFKACVEENRVRSDRSTFYVKWAQAFVNFLPGKRLRERSRQDIEGFLAELAKRPAVKDWQVRQAEHAVKILYETFLPGYSPETAANPAVKMEEKKTAACFPVKRAGRFRDRVVPGEVERLFAPLIDALKAEIRSRHYSIRTETAYADWVRRFIAFQEYADPRRIDATAAVKDYLEYLAIVREVAASTQNQVLNALVFFYAHALKMPFGDMGGFVRAKRPQRLPEVMTREEVQALLSEMEGVSALMAGLMYGGGFRLMECVRLRVKDVDFDRHQIMVRDGKGQKDRVTMLPERFVPPLRDHLARVKVMYEKDRAKGIPGVFLWPALARKYPKAASEWRWQYVFPAKGLSVDPRSGTVRSFDREKVMNCRGVVSFPDLMRYNP